MTLLLQGEDSAILGWKGTKIKVRWDSKRRSFYSSCGALKAFKRRGSIQTLGGAIEYMKLYYKD